MRNVVIVGGVSFWSDFRFTDRPGQPASYPGIVQDFANTFRLLRSLPCDVFLGAHGGYFRLKAKLPRLAQSGPQIFLDAAGYQAFVTRNEEDFEAAMKKEQ